MREPRAVVLIQTILEGLDVEWRAILQDVVVMMGRDEERKSFYQIQTTWSVVARDHGIEDVKGPGG